LRVLERAGLISTAIDAQRRPRRIEATPLKDATAWLEKYRIFWEVRYDNLEELLGEMESDNSKKSRKKETNK
jgi:hypothetical protein